MSANALKEKLKNVQIEKVSDVSVFQELEWLKSELLNSNDDTDKLLAHKIQHSLNNNPNYFDFLKRDQIEELKTDIEKKEEKFKQQQEIRLQNAIVNSERKREEIKQNENRSKEIADNFRKLTETQQKLFLAIEKNFPPEYREDLRTFALTTGTSEEKKEQNVDLINKVMGKEILEIQNGKTDVKEGITYDELSQVIPTQDAIVDAAIVAKNSTAALEGTQIRVNIGAEQAAIKSKEDNILVFSLNARLGNDKKTIEERHINTEKTIKFIDILKDNKTLERYEEKLNIIKEFGNPDEIKTKEKEIAQDFIDKLKKAEINLNQVDKEKITAYLEQLGSGKQTTELLHNAIVKNAKDYTAYDQQMDEKLQNYLTKKAIQENSTNSELEFDYSPTADVERNYQVFYAKVEEQNRKQQEYEQHLEHKQTYSSEVENSTNLNI